ncbi:MAG: enoyl-CoA hydratase/isomerase family protein [Bradyrhizobium sp.]|uniref:enoyl-CoA hydratase-related protein n=1 Tax=Bradyrhizobium sp. TaxID=376 RepID=UPI001DB98F5A|nr:enoyl-CoA hydratase-related protein [Bradyrhizobium sp.]MBV9559032.1 enoyl-CoA hydratase/isomerase family protein [Bradyrhizobium sp.]
MPGPIIIADDDATRTITMRRPEKKNAISHEMFLAMSEAINSAQSDPAIRCLILTGRSGVFTSGDDVSDFVNESEAPRDPARPRGSIIFLRALVNNKKPIIAAVDGVAAGMGTTMVLHCDYVIAGTTASFFSPLIQYGLGPEGASSLLLPRIAGYQRAFSLLVMGRAMSAEEARSAGLVNVVVPPGHAIVEAQKAAREICALSPEAVAISRKLLKPPTEDLLRRMGQEEHLFAERIRSPSVLAAVKSFLSRKKR